MQAVLMLTAYCYVIGKPDFEGALFIDEGQDYFENEYRLIAECTRATVNVYGDENQQIDAARGIGSFSKLDALWKTWSTIRSTRTTATRAKLTST